MAEKDSIREAFLCLQQRLAQSVELFQSLKCENRLLRSQISELEERMKALLSASSWSEGEVARLLDERKRVREKAERILEAVSRLQSGTQG